jgi:hypothetical protein
MQQQLPRAYATEEKTWGRSGFVDSWEVSIYLQYSRGKVLSIPLFQTANCFHSYGTHIPVLFPSVFPCSKRGHSGLEGETSFSITIKECESFITVMARA